MTAKLTGMEKVELMVLLEKRLEQAKMDDEKKVLRRLESIKRKLEI